MDEEIPGLGTYAVPGFGGDMPPMRESDVPATSPSQVPGKPNGEDGAPPGLPVAAGLGYRASTRPHVAARKACDARGRTDCCAIISRHPQEDGSCG